jgi:hypothetical protein
MRNIFFLLLILAFGACNKSSEWLDKKAANSDVVPATLKDYQAILDYDLYMNSSYPYLGMVSSDNYYVPYSSWLNDGSAAKYAYSWEAEIFLSGSSNEWNYPYKIVISSNIVLEGLMKLDATPATRSAIDQARGSALFYRSMAFHQLAQLFGAPYVAATAATDLSIPLRLTADVNEVSKRATVQQVYAQLIQDLTEAESLLPATATIKTRPSAAAAAGLLARVYLDMEDYPAAGAAARRARARYSTLIDYNSLNAAASYPLPSFQNDNKEVIFHAEGLNYVLCNLNGLIDSVIYQSYTSSDLRKTLFYKTGANGGYNFRGSYTGGLTGFCGIAVNELFLISAECYARAGNVTGALTELNTLLQKRWKQGTFTPITATDGLDALTKILLERRKELPFTGGLRWADLRRLNRDTRFAKTLTRNLNGQIVSLSPGDKRYVLPIPFLEIRLSGIGQNPR